jgi:hypothetical protein
MLGLESLQAAFPHVLVAIVVEEKENFEKTL